MELQFEIVGSSMKEINFNINNKGGTYKSDLNKVFRHKGFWRHD